MKKTLILLFVIFSIIMILGCSQSDNDPDNATLSGYVRYSSQNKSGVPNVYVVIEGMQNGYNLYEQTKTDSRGHWSMSVFLGMSEEGAYNYQFPDVELTYYYPDLNTPLQTDAIKLTLYAGKEVEMPVFYLY